MSIKNRVTELLGVAYPIIQAPMGWIARAPLASAVSNAGGMGIIETASGDLPVIRAEIARMRDLTDKPFGVNIALSYVRDPSIVQFVVDNGVRFVTTSAGDPTRLTTALKAAGLTVFHVVPTLKAALKAVEAGVDGLIVEGGERRRLQEPARCRFHGAAAAGLLEGEGAGGGGRRFLRRRLHGRSVCAGRRRHPDGHAHARRERIADP